MNKEIQEVKNFLSRTRSLIQKLENWTKYLWARDQFGRDIEPTSEYATCWCLLGALKKERQELGVSVKTYRFAIELLQVHIGKGEARSITGFNDASSHGEVLSLLSRVISEIDSKEDEA